jgi:hypothetical protein
LLKSKIAQKPGLKKDKNKNIPKQKIACIVKNLPNTKFAQNKVIQKKVAQMDMLNAFWVFCLGVSFG